MTFNCGTICRYTWSCIISTKKPSNEPAISTFFPLEEGPHLQFPNQLKPINHDVGQVYPDKSCGKKYSHVYCLFSFDILVFSQAK